MNISILTLFFCITMLAISAISCAGSRSIIIECDSFRYEVSPTGKNIGFICKHTGRDYLDHSTESTLAGLSKNGVVYDPTYASLENGILTIRFGKADVETKIKVESHCKWVEFHVVSISDPLVDLLTFISIPLALKGRPGEDFAATVLALNYQVEPFEEPGHSTKLAAWGVKEFGIPGAAAYIVASPGDEFRKTLQQAVSSIPEMPQSPHAGPWALDSDFCKESYLMDYPGLISESSVDQWINIAKSCGIRMIDFHCGPALRFGDYMPNPELYPNGYNGLKQVIDKLHSAGIKASLHTYMYFIDKATSWVTPVPSKHLKTGNIFTLAEDMTQDADRVLVDEPTGGVSTVTAFHVRNSVTLRIDDELITFTGVSSEAPHSFTGCTRGAYGTVPAPHSKASRVYQLRELWGLFAPDPDSPLFAEVAAAIADVCNKCGFDAIFYDACDGADVLGPGQYGWNYNRRFQYEVWKRLAKPTMVDMNYNYWPMRSKLGPWDAPCIGFKHVIDMHCMSNDNLSDALLPHQLGWTALFTGNNIQPQRVMPEDVEYMCCKSLGYDAGISVIAGFDNVKFHSSHNQQKLAALIKQYEDLRRSGAIDEDVKKKLREPGMDYKLELISGKPAFRRVEYTGHKIEATDNGAAKLDIANKFDSQPAKFRIEALYSPASYDSPDAITILDFSRDIVFGESKANEGVTVSLTANNNMVKTGNKSACIIAANSSKEPFRAWTSTEIRLDQTIDLSRKGLGFWIYGDGSGALLNLQLGNPPHASTAVRSHLIKLDFTGWKYAELIEPEFQTLRSYEWSDLNYAGDPVDRNKSIYIPQWQAYRHFILWFDYTRVDSITFCCNNIPNGGDIKCYISPIKALPLRSIKIVNPSVEIDGKKMVFPVALESGQYMEFHTLSDCIVYNSDCEPIGKVTPTGDVPTIEHGHNSVRFDSESAENVRANITVITEGGV